MELPKFFKHRSYFTPGNEKQQNKKDIQQISCVHLDDVDRA